MTEAPPQSDFERLQVLFSKQTPTNFIAALECKQDETGQIFIQKNGPESAWIPCTAIEAAETWKRREQALIMAQDDMFRHGFEPPVWSQLDWLVCELRVRNPNVAIELLVLGGNGSGKSYYGISRLIRCGVYNSEWLLWNFTTDELKSKTVMQQIAYRYLPKELRTTSGKVKRDRDQHIIFKNASGFTDNKIGLPSLDKRKRGSVIQHRFHSSEIDTLTGPRPQFAYSDEEITLPWVNAITNRLHTAAEKASVNLDLFRELLEQKKANPHMKFPPNKVHLLFLGVHLITFTPENGYSSVVHAFTKDAITVKEVDAELLPLKDDDGNFTGYEKVPKMQWCKLPHRAVFYMHPYENAHGGNWEGMKIAARTKTRENILWWAYGIASRKSHVLFPKFSFQTHVRKESMLPKDGDWYHIVDPAPGRNMFMWYVKVNPLHKGFLAREWPMESDFIPGVGYPGPWAVEGQKLDGEKGPAQNSFGWGMQQYCDEMFRIEHALWKLENPGNPDPNGRIEIPPGNRIMDSRTGNTPTMEHDSAETLIIKFGKLGIDFWPSGKESGAKDGTTRVDESTDLLADLLSYDDEKMIRNADGSVTFNGKSPDLYICERCTNTIFSFSTWTGADGQKGACKDPADTGRMYAMAAPYYRIKRQPDETEQVGVY